MHNGMMIYGCVHTALPDIKQRGEAQHNGQV